MSRTTVVIGASGGIGAAFVRQAGVRGDTVIALARSLSGEDHIDLEDEASIAAAAARLADRGLAPDRVIVATGLLHADGRGPEKSMKDLDAAWMARNFAVNTIGPALAAKHFIPLMPRKAPALFAAIGARVGSISDNRLGGWYGYRASKAALNQIVRTAAIELARIRPQAVCVALHPGTVDTDLSKPFQRGVPPEKLFTPAHSAGRLLAVLDALTPAQSGRIFAWDGAEIAP